MYPDMKADAFNTPAQKLHLLVGVKQCTVQTIQIRQTRMISHCQHNMMISHCQHNMMISHCQHNMIISHCQHNMMISHCQHNMMISHCQHNMMISHCQHNMMISHCQHTMMISHLALPSSEHPHVLESLWAASSPCQHVQSEVIHRFFLSLHR